MIERYELQILQFYLICSLFSLLQVGELVAQRLSTITDTGTKLFAFPIAVILLEKAWIHLFPAQLWTDSKEDWAL